jgi:outer membrane protein OmpA-like peptidoglycan-associated protein
MRADQARVGEVGAGEDLPAVAVGEHHPAQRAGAVRDALVRRGLPQRSLRAKGVGAAEPIEGLEPSDPASDELLFEVAKALRPCTGSVIAIVGHTDAAGNEAAKVALSSQRAAAVRDALVRRGLPQRSLRAKGVGAAEPIEGLEPADPANRRIEFSLIVPASVRPTPIDTPGPG